MENEESEKKLYYSMQDLLPDVMKKLNANASDRKKAIIRKRWEYIIGKRLHKYCHFVRCERNILYIQAESQSYVTLFNMYRRGIISRYNEVFPNDRIVSLVVYSDSSMYSM